MPELGSLNHVARGHKKSRMIRRSTQPIMEIAGITKIMDIAGIVSSNP
jgi:hypothetical protein